MFSAKSVPASTVTSRATTLAAFARAARSPSVISVAGPDEEMGDFDAQAHLVTINSR